MSHSEMYEDGKEITKFIKADGSGDLAKKFGELSRKAFANGATEVEQRIIKGNEVCPMCESGIRFDLCCGAEK